MLEYSTVKILWDFGLFTDRLQSSNCPDIVVFEKQIYFIEISCPADINVALKEVEKLTKYHDLAVDFHVWKASYDCACCTGVVSTACLDYTKKIPKFSPKLFANLQKGTIIGAICTLRTFQLNFRD